MAQGDIDDVFKRLFRLLPYGWFPDVIQRTANAPVLSTLLYLIASPLSYAYQVIAAVGLSARLATSSGILLDMAAQDFFGVGGLPRFSGEEDTDYLQRIQKTLIAKKNTREAVSTALAVAGAVNPSIIESGNADDCGFYAVGSLSRGGYGNAALRYSGSPGEFYVDSTNGATVAQISNAVVTTKAEGVKAWIRTSPPS